ncbi:hypothetical protein ACQ4M3_18935 [Leptolyngbya sp. AN03gr2]|uniref:hypothetical protein n=1 Tax=Leptolyngbya sp. AN03gr2 TaxID=3423364 RepID=UPI003D31105E
MPIESYAGINGLAVSADNAKELYEAIDYVHTLAVELDESNPQDETAQFILKLLNQLLSDLEPLAEKHNWF